MNSSILILGSALMFGADPAPAAPAAAPAVVAVTTGCGGGVTWAAAPTVCHPMPSCDPCERVGLLARLRARLAALRPAKSCCADPCAQAPCAPAPAPCAPAPCTPSCGKPLFTGFTTSCADPCERVGLLARLRAKFHGSRSCDACTAPQVSASCTGCAASAGVITAPATTPAAMPAPGTAKPAETKPAEPKKEEPKKEVSVQVPGVPQPMASSLLSERN